MYLRWQLDMIGVHEFGGACWMWLVPAFVAVAVDVFDPEVCGMTIG